MATSTSKLAEWKRQRGLSGSRRTARYSRNQAWERIQDFTQQFWWMLILIPAGFVLALLPLALRTNGVVRGMVLGGAAVSGLWFDVLIALVWTGAASKFMGASGEVSTSEVLRDLARSGWRLVNNVTLDGWGDIDHIVVGPGGVLVVESKWSADRWPVSGYGSRSMESRKKNAASQVQRNAKDVVDWLGEAGIDLPVMSLAVFWTGARKCSAGWELWRNKTTVLVNGPSLRSWLRTELPRGGVDSEMVERVYSMLGQRVDDQDRVAIEAGESVPPTLGSLSTEWALKPMVGLILATYTIWLTHFFHDWRVAFATAVAATGLGLWAFRFKSIRTAAVGWSAMSFGFVIAVIVFLLHSAIQ